ncbi:MAG: DUF2975 domain-containing protein [Lachnospiraceae bacterium]|nr:DUF2975 domain-containing protein [Lachnospiraceae bacterium]
MEKLKKLSKVMNVVFKLVLLIAVIQFGRCLVDLWTNGIAVLKENQGAEFIKISDYTLGNCGWHFLNGQKIETSYFIKGIVLEFVEAVFNLVGLVFLVCTSEKLLKPMTKGQPYNGTASKTLRTLGVGCILICVAGNVIAYLQAARSSHILSEIRRIFMPVTLTGIEVNFGVSLGYLFIGIMTFVLSLVFRYGEELQVQADETL